MELTYKTGVLQQKRPSPNEFTIHVSLEKNIPLVYTVGYANEDEEKINTILDLLIASYSVSGGRPVVLSYSSTLKCLVGNLCNVQLTLSDCCVIHLTLRINKIDFYSGDDSCFPFACGNNH